MGCPDEEGAHCPATLNHPSREEGIVVCMQWAVQTRKSGFMYLYIAKRERVWLENVRVGRSVVKDRVAAISKLWCSKKK